MIDNVQQLFVAEYENAKEWMGIKFSFLKNLDGRLYLILQTEDEERPLAPEYRRVIMEMGDNADVMSLKPFGGNIRDITEATYSMIQSRVSPGVEIFFIGHGLSSDLYGFLKERLVKDGFDPHWRINHKVSFHKTKKTTFSESSNKKNESRAFALGDIMNDLGQEDEPGINDNGSMYMNESDFVDISPFEDPSVKLRKDGPTSDSAKEEKKYSNRKNSFENQSKTMDSGNKKNAKNSHTKGFSQVPRIPVLIDAGNETIDELEQIIFGRETEKGKQRQYTELENEKANLLDMIFQRLVNGINKMLSIPNPDEIKSSQYTEFVITVLKAVDYEDFIGCWNSMGGVLPKSIDEETYNYILEEAQYYMNLCDDLYEKDKW